MPGRAPKQKGDRLERAIVATLKAHGIDADRVPLSGSAPGYPGDVRAVLGGQELTLECKSRKDFATLYGWLRERDGLILKADRKEPLLVVRLADALKLVEGVSQIRNRIKI